MSGPSFELHWRILYWTLQFKINHPPVGLKGSHATSRDTPSLLILVVAIGKCKQANEFQQYCNGHLIVSYSWVWIGWLAIKSCPILIKVALFIHSPSTVHRKHVPEEQEILSIGEKWFTSYTLYRYHLVMKPSFHCIIHDKEIAKCRTSESCY